MIIRVPRSTQQPMQIPSAKSNQLPKEVETEIVSKITLQHTFNVLESKYYEACQKAHTYGVFAQQTIDSAYNLLAQFVEQHPEFQLPVKFFTK